MRVRVAVIDDDDISRRGLAELLADLPEIEVAASLTHDEAMCWLEEWDDIDVALVDAADERRGDDHFPGVGVVEAIRTRRNSTEAMIIVLTGHFFDDAVRRRMREAKADYLYHRSELQDATALYQAVLRPDPERPGVPEIQDPEIMFRHGVTRRTQVNAGVEFARSSGMNSRAGAQRRAQSRLRAAFNQVARLNPVNTDGSPPDRDQAEPSMPQIDRFLQWATRSKHQQSP